MKRALRAVRLSTVASAVLVMAGVLPAAPAAAFERMPHTERISVSPGGDIADDGSITPSVSASGRYVAFVSWATNLVAGPSSDDSQVYLRDRIDGTTILISRRCEPADTRAARRCVHGSAASPPGNFDSWAPALSASGRFVAFASQAADLVEENEPDGTCDWPDPPASCADVFVHDRDLDEDGIFDEPGQTATVLVSVAEDGTRPRGDAGSRPSISDDGRYVVFAADTPLVEGDTNEYGDVYRHDADPLGDGLWGDDFAVDRISVSSTGAQADGESYAPTMTADGTQVAFASWATNLVGGDTLSLQDVFTRDTMTGITRRVSVGAGDQEANGFSRSPWIARGGRYVAFSSVATNLIDDAAYGTHVLGRSGTQSQASTWACGAAARTICGDRNQVEDVFVSDLESGATMRASIGAFGEANGASRLPSMTPDGRYVAFYSDADNLVRSDSNGALDAFVADLHAGTIRRVSVSSSGIQADHGASGSDRCSRFSEGWYPPDDFGCTPAISDDGAIVAFDSTAGGMLDGNVFPDEDQIYVRDRGRCPPADDGQSSLPDGPASSRIRDLVEPELSARDDPMVGQGRASDAAFGVPCAVASVETAAGS